jgi:hypothetical protein
MIRILHGSKALPLWFGRVLKHVAHWNAVIRHEVSLSTNTSAYKIYIPCGMVNTHKQLVIFISNWVWHWQAHVVIKKTNLDVQHVYSIHMELVWQITDDDRTNQGTYNWRPFLKHHIWQECYVSHRTYPNQVQVPKYSISYRTYLTRIWTCSSYVPVPRIKNNYLIPELHMTHVPCTHHN